jgi:hypothetical protein
VDEAGRRAAMWTMAVDAVTVEVMAALAQASVDCVLLKGPSIAAWLYDDPAERPYVDTDLLVEPGRLGTAAATLETRGFRRAFGPLPHPGMEGAPSYPWRRGAVEVDVHQTLPGATADGRQVWDVLRPGCEELVVAGTPTRVLGRPARLAHVALHAAHHGPRVERPIEDVRQALRRAPDEEWREAADVAARIGASRAFAAGVALGRGEQPAAEVPLAAGLERVSAATGMRAKGRILAEEVVPSAEFMRWWAPLARRSRRGLAAAYVLRWAYLAVRAPAAVSAWRRMNRVGRSEDL